MNASRWDHLNLTNVMGWTDGWNFYPPVEVGRIFFSFLGCV